MIYDAMNRKVLDLIPHDAKAILDVGCGTGALGQFVKQRQTCRFVGITASPQEAALARGALDEVLERDLEELEPVRETFDVIVLSHVLEHLRRPQATIDALKPSLRDRGVMIVAIPNVLWWRQRLRFLGGHFRYSHDGGLMDETHVHFFDIETIRELLVAAGLRVTRSDATGCLPGSRFFGPAARVMDRTALRFWPGAFAHELLFVAQSG